MGSKFLSSPHQPSICMASSSALMQLSVTCGLFSLSSFACGEKRECIILFFYSCLFWQGCGSGLVFNRYKLLHVSEKTGSQTSALQLKQMWPKFLMGFHSFGRFVCAGQLLRIIENIQVALTWVHSNLNRFNLLISYERYIPPNFPSLSGKVPLW